MPSLDHSSLSLPVHILVLRQEIVILCLNCYIYGMISQSLFIYRSRKLFRLIVIDASECTPQLT